MKSVVVPSQITTLEDYVAGKMTLTQLFLVMAPVFIGTGIILGLPPFARVSDFKITILIATSVFFLSLAVRIHGVLILGHVILRARYYSHPKLHLYDKNDVYLRNIPNSERAAEPTLKLKPEKYLVDSNRVRISAPTSARIAQWLTDPTTSVNFEITSKGKLRGAISTRK